MAQISLTSTNLTQSNSLTFMENFEMALDQNWGTPRKFWLLSKKNDWIQHYKKHNN